MWEREEAREGGRLLFPIQVLEKGEESGHLPLDGAQGRW